MLHRIRSICRRFGFADQPGAIRRAQAVACASKNPKKTSEFSCFR
jgi:hypothetical protein